MNTIWDTLSRLLCCVSVCYALPFDYTLSGHNLVPLLFVYVRWMNLASCEDRAGRRLTTIIRRVIKSAAAGGHQTCEPLGKAPTTPCDLHVWISLTIGVSTIPRTGRSPMRTISQFEGSRFPIASKWDGTTSIPKGSQPQWGSGAEWNFRGKWQNPSVLFFTQDN